MKKVNIKKINIKKNLFFCIFLFLVLVSNFSVYINTFSEYVTSIEPLASGIINNVVTINDLSSDYNYYKGLNYISSDGTIPTLENKNIYNDNTLVEVKTTYYGYDYENQNHGYVSLNERQDTYVYYKVYYVNDNGTSTLSDDYIEFDLIDNPFTDRPQDKGFNGWLIDDSTVTISFDKDYYVRKARVKVSYENNKPKPIELTFFANWVDAKISFLNNNWTTAFETLADYGMTPIGGSIPVYESVEELYLRGTISFGSSYPDGAVGSNGRPVTGRCTSLFSSCTYYYKSPTSEYDSTLTYYKPNNGGNMTTYNVRIDHYDELPRLPKNKLLYGYFVLTDVSYGAQLTNYFDSTGNPVTTCSTRNGCTYYRLISDMTSKADGTTIYYYLTTRDTNIIVMNTSVNSKWSENGTKPFTLTSIHNGTNYNTTWNVSNQYITCYNDTSIENLTINSQNGNSTGNPASNATTTRYLYGNNQNVKLGRGIKQSGNYKTFNGVFGGNNNTRAAGSSTAPIRYKLIVESGFYNTITLTNGPSNTNNTKYIEAKAIYGNDYDRVANNDNNLDVYFLAGGSWGTGNYYSPTIAFSTVVKSGKYGTSKYDHTTGIYVGGRSYGTHNAVRDIYVEGGWIYNLIGGPLTATNRTNVNDIYMYIKGGSIDVVIGGAGTSTTYGNRIISVTDGTINYSVFGGSNSYEGGSSDGKLSGSSYVYIGGNAQIGNSDYASSTLWGAESGSVFGIGNGNNSSSSIGSNDNSNIVIADNAMILKNVYGGGNYSATGVSNSRTTTTNIKVIGGTIQGSIYGGGNRNGSGASNVESTISIDVYDGTINNIYGGSRTEGTIYGNSNLKIYGGTINNIYGGGEGASTYITKNINIVFGSNDYDTTPILNNNMYGGSAFGRVNGTTTSTNYKTDIIINKGNIFGSVFAGAQGNSSYSPYVYGDVSVTVNNGTINKVFGSNDYSGIIYKTSNIYLNNGTINEVYGGGNKTSLNTSNIYQRGATVDYIYGGSNESGDVTTSNITIANGSVINVYGGNNLGGTTTTSNINISGGNITGIVYGGGKLTDTTNTNVTIANAEIPSVYGGGENANAGNTNIKVNSGTIDEIYGGSNESGNVNKSTITITNGTINNIYGGNNIGGTTTTTSVNVNGGTITGTIYGGGKLTDTTNTNVVVTNGTINNIYGGGENANADHTNIRVTQGNIEEIYGGSNESGNVIDSTLTIENGTINNIYGGNNIGGTTTTTSVNVNGGTITGIIYGAGKLTNTTNANVTVNNGNLSSVYGGGENADALNTTIVVNHGTIDEIYGGSNESGTVDKSTIIIENGTINDIYGGNNIGGTTTATKLNIKSGNIINLYGGGNNTETGSANITLIGGHTDYLYGGGNKEDGITTDVVLDLNGGTIDNIYGGGNKALTSTTIININGSEITNLYGGGNDAGLDTTNINLTSGKVTNLYGGSNSSGTVSNSNIKTINIVPSSLTMQVNYDLVEVNPYWQNTNYNTVATLNVILTNNTDNDISDFTAYIKQNNSTLYNNYSEYIINEENGTYTFNHVNRYNNTNHVIRAHNSINIQFTIYSKQTIDEFKLDDYGVNTANAILPELIIDNLYGGNNLGGIVENSNIDLNRGTYINIYGGGNKARLNNTQMSLNNILVQNNIYGGGNEALVATDTNLYVNNCEVLNSIYGGGNFGAVVGNTNIHVIDSDIKNSIYAGGNGSSAIVNKNTNLLIDGNTKVGKHVFGGGNASPTGTEENNNSKSEVNIAGATINGNVYGGANTSVLYGTTNVNIGYNTINIPNIKKANIKILGTVFGGGEANESGSENYDYSFISVTEGITINIDGSSHDEFSISGSIFGSGNASSTKGYSNIYIKNYGNKTNYQKNISLQRADIITLDNSVIELLGATDRTNEYSTVLFSLSRIKQLKLKNNSTIYLYNGANLVEEFTSAVDINGNEELATVTIDNGVTRNVDNRVYMKAGKNLNIALNENATSYGKINGMAFLGMYERDRNNLVTTGMYDSKYNYNDEVSNDDAYMFDLGSYVLAIHETDHNIKKNGFYTNYVENGINKINYIKPTPDDSTYYMWSIGEQVVTAEISLTASKYLTLGFDELVLLNYSVPNISFSILGFNYNNLDSNVSLINEADIPRIASTTEDADNIMSLVMKPANNGFMTKGQTEFKTSGETISGVKLYQTDNSTDVPTFQFYLNHSKNLGTSGSMGSVTISFVVIIPVDDLNNTIERMNLIVNLDRALYNSNDYEAAITPGKEYGVFTSDITNLASDGSFSAYYSLYVKDSASIYKNGYHRTLVSNYVLPVNTKLTLINKSKNSVSEYYYYVVSQKDYDKALKEYNKDGECSYDFSNFIRMGSDNSNNNFNDSLNNISYYNAETGISYEDFIVIVDFADANITETVKDKTLLIELRNNQNKTVVSVLGIEQERMVYSLYKDSNAVVELTGKISTNNVYPGKSVKLNLNTDFKKKMVGSDYIQDTNYFDQQLGVRISYLDSNGNPISGISLLGLTYTYDNVVYYPRADGSVRINISEKMANVNSTIVINTTDEVATGDYIMLIESFGSPDGIYYGLNPSSSMTLPISFLNTVYGLSMEIDDYVIVIDKDTGNNLNGNNDFRFNLRYSSSLTNPNLKMKLSRRNYDEIYSTKYDLVDLQDYFTETLTSSNGEYVLTNAPLSDFNYQFTFKDNLKTGTYKFEVSLYDSNTYIGSVYKYIVVKEKYNE